jgi:hypothetical protein
VTPRLRQLIPSGLLLALAVTGCATDDTPTGGGGSGRVVKADPSYSEDIQEIFNRRGCTASSCHGSIPQGGLDLRAGTSYGELVDVPSVQSPLVRVRPGHAQDSSYLVDRLDGTSPAPRMPQGGAPLDATDMQNIINWISQGAPNN